MPKHFELRPTLEQDRTYIARLNFLTDVFGDENAPISSSFAEDFRYYVDGWSAPNGGYIAWEGNIPAGGVWLTWGTKQRHGYGHAEVGIPELAIAVESRYTGQGLGTMLLDAATNLARSLGAPGISLCVDVNNPRARRLYEHIGFKEIRSDGHFYVMLKRF